MTVAGDLLGANAPTVLEQLQRELKRQSRNASNKQVNLAGVDTDAVMVGIRVGDSDLTGYTPFIDPTPG